MSDIKKNCIYFITYAASFTACSSITNKYLMYILIFFFLVSGACVGLKEKNTYVLLKDFTFTACVSIAFAIFPMQCLNRLNKN